MDPIFFIKSIIKIISILLHIPADIYHSPPAGWVSDFVQTSGETTGVLPGNVWRFYVCSHGQADELVCHASAGQI